MTTISEILEGRKCPICAKSMWALEAVLYSIFNIAYHNTYRITKNKIHIKIKHLTLVVDLKSSQIIFKNLRSGEKILDIIGDIPKLIVNAKCCNINCPSDFSYNFQIEARIMVEDKLYYFATVIDDSISFITSDNIVVFLLNLSHRQETTITFNDLTTTINYLNFKTLNYQSPETLLRDLQKMVIMV